MHGCMGAWAQGCLLHGRLCWWAMATCGAGIVPQPLAHNSRGRKQACSCRLSPRGTSHICRMGVMHVVTRHGRRYNNTFRSKDGQPFASFCIDLSADPSVQVRLASLQPHTACPCLPCSFSPMAARLSRALKGPACHRHHMIRAHALHHIPQYPAAQLMGIMATVMQNQGELGGMV